MNEKILESISEQVEGIIIKPELSPVPHIILGVTNNGYVTQPMFLT